MDFRDLLLMNLVSWQLHPGYQREGTRVPSLSEIFDLVEAVDRMRSDKWL